MELICKLTFNLDFFNSWPHQEDCVWLYFYGLKSLFLFCCLLIHQNIGVGENQRGLVFKAMHVQVIRASFRVH